MAIRAFNFKGFAKFTYKSLFKSRGAHYRLTPRRIKWLILFYIAYPLLELVTWVGLLLDEILFKEYQGETISQPVFIIGTPRSGTTFLQRLLAKDKATFNSMRTWEIFLAPSITMRRIVNALAAVDRTLGSPLHGGLAALEKRWQKENVMHKVALDAPEEDDYLLVHIWSSLKVWLFAAMLEDALPYAYFDTAMPKEEQDRILTFYRRCLQRHLYAHGVDHRHYLSKNPHFTPMIGTLLRYFPDAKIIYLARNPMDVIPSLINMKDHEWNLLGNPLKRYACRDYALDATLHWYTYPLELLEGTCQYEYVVIDFNDLVGDPRRTVSNIYDRFGFEISPAFTQVLERETERARNYESKHEYSLEEIGLSRERILIEYETVFERFGFDTREKALGHGRKE